MAEDKQCGHWITQHFDHLDDPRTGNRLQHQLSDVVSLTIIAVLCGCDDFATIEQFGKLRLDWLRQFRSTPRRYPLPRYPGTLLSNYGPRTS